MLKVDDSIASCEQDNTTSNVSLVELKSRNGYVSMPSLTHGLRYSDQACNMSLCRNKDHVEIRNEEHYMRNGVNADKSFSEPCQVINITSSAISEDNACKHAHITSINEDHETTQDLTYNTDSSPALLRVNRTKGIDDLSLTSIMSEASVDSSKNSMSTILTKSEICSGASRLAKCSFSLQKSVEILMGSNMTKTNQIDMGEETLKSFSEGCTINEANQDIELKNFKGQKAKKTLIAYSSFREDIQTKEQDSDKLASSVPIMSNLDKICLKNQSASNLNSSKSTSETLAGMTIKVNVLENALGLSTKSFSQLDAKTFDRIVLSVFQHKGLGQARKSSIGARTSAKFGLTSRHANRRIGSAFMTEPLHSSQNSLMHRAQCINSISSTHSDEALTKRSVFLAKKTSVPSLFSFGKVEASEFVDSESRSSNSCVQDSSSRSAFVQKARKSSHLPWSHKCNLGNSENSPNYDEILATSQLISSENTLLMDVNFDKRNEYLLENEEKTCMQTRQSFKRKWDSFEREDITSMDQIKEKRIKSDYKVQIPGLRHRDGYHSLSSEINSGNIVSSARFKNQHEAFEEVASYDPFCLCCCLLPGITNSFVSKCEAIDSFDGKTLGCSRKVTNFEMLRPSAGIPFRAFCDEHRKKLKEHQCCPGCGLFCTQGNFFECKEENRQEITIGNKSFKDMMLVSLHRDSNAIHRFHKQCQVFSADNKCYCPHCFSESFQLEGMVYNNEPRPATFIVQPGYKANKYGPDQTLRRSGSARFCIPKKDLKNKNGSVCSDSQKSFRSNPSEDIKNGLDFHGLLESFGNDTSLKWKKIRPCPKSLCLACKSGDTGKVLYILGEGIDPTIKPDDIVQPAIHLASKYNHKDIVEILLSAGVSADSIDHELHTPLMEASQNGSIPVIELLIKAGCSVDARAHDGMTALHLAAKSGKKEALKHLLGTRKIDINAQDDGGWTALIWATEHGHKDCIAFLLSLGANPNLKDNELNTSLHWAAYTGNEDIVVMFLDAGCFIDDINDHGDTPIHIAARQDHFKCVEVLLWRWADISITNKAGLTPVQCCLEEKCKSAQHLKLVSHMPNRPKEKILSRDISRGRESCPIMVVNCFDSEDALPDFSYILGYVETSPINVNRLVTSLQVCTCLDNCLSSSSCSCCRSSVKRWYDENGRLSSSFNYSEPPLIFECNMMCSCRTTCLNRVVQLGTINNLQVFRTSGRGWGCRTLRDIAKGTFVCEYAGELITDEEANRREDDSYLFDLDFQDSDTYCIDAARYGNVSRFINHLCEPNVIPVKVFVDHQDLRFPRICFFASKDIKAFDELGFDYGYKFWSIKWKFFTCTCGSQNCKYSKDTILKTIEEYNKLHMDEGEDE